MAAAAEERLVVALEARIRDFERDMQRGRKAANDNLGAIEKRAETMASRLRKTFSTIGSALGGAAGIGGLGLAGVFAGAKQAAADLAQIAAEAKRAGVAVEAFQELKYAADQSMVGIDALTDGIKELQLRADEFIVTGAGGGAEAFARLGYSAEELKAKLADPAALFEEIIEKLGRLDKASQIRIADEIFGGTGGEQFVRMLDQGNGYIARMRQEARDTGNVLDADLIQRAVEIDRQFAKIATTVGTHLKGALVAVVSQLAAFADLLRATENQSASTLQSRIDLLNAAAENMRKSTMAFALGGGEEGIQRRLDEAAALQAQLDSKPGTSITLNKSPASGAMGDLSQIGKAKELAGAYDQLVESAERRIAQMATEQQALGMTTAEAEALRVRQDLLNEAQRLGITLTAEQSAKLNELAARSGEAAAALESAAQSQARSAQYMQQWQSISTDAVSGFVTDLRNGVEAADALENALNKVLDTLIEMAIQESLKGLFGGLGGMGGMGGGMGAGGGGMGGGGLIGGLLGIVGSLFGFAKGGPVKLATGGPISGTGSGTSDSIPAMLSNGEFVVRASQARKFGPVLEAINSGRAGAFADGGFVLPQMPAAANDNRASGTTPQIKVVVNNKAPGVEAQVQQTPDGGLQIDIQRMVRTGIQSALEEGYLDEPAGRRWGVRRHIP